MKNFRDLRVWNEARELTKAVYSASKNFPQSEQYGLTSQLRRAAVSVCANIAEGAGQNSDNQFARYLNIAFGSASEASCLLQLATDLEFLSEKDRSKLDDGVNSVQRMLHGLMQKISGD